MVLFTIRLCYSRVSALISTKGLNFGPVKRKRTCLVTVFSLFPFSREAKLLIIILKMKRKRTYLVTVLVLRLANGAKLLSSAASSWRRAVLAAAQVQKGLPQQAPAGPRVRHGR